MKRLVLAAGLALALHAALFYGGWDPLGKGKTVDLRPHQITLNLSYLPSLSSPPPSVEKKPLIIKKERPKQEVKPKKPPKQVKRLVSPQKPAKKAPKKPEPVLKPKPAPAPPVEQEPSVPTEFALPASVKEDSPPDIQETEQETPSNEARENLDSRVPVTVSTSALPLYKRNPAPKYPRSAKRRGYEGKVILNVLVNREGKVESLAILQSSGHKVLDKAAQKAVATWLFSPARRGKERVAMWIKVPIRFDLQ